MARGSSSQREGSKSEPNAVADERKRLKKLAFTNNVLSKTQAENSRQLSPSKLVINHHGKDIVKKSQRKNRFLFSFPGLIAPIGGGKIGELKDLNTKNPILYLDFPQGQIKLFGTIVYPENRYLTLHFPKGKKDVMCEDYFDNMIVFSDAWWIGKKDANPEEKRLDFPMEMKKGQCADYEFKGGAGAAYTNKKNSVEDGETLELPSKFEFEDDFSNDQENLDHKNATPSRQSERTRGRTFKFLEDSSGDDGNESEGEEKKVAELNSSVRKNAQAKMKNLFCSSIENDKDVMEVAASPEHKQISPLLASKSTPLSQCSSSGISSKINARNNHGSLVQATISTLFNKVEEKKTPRKATKVLLPKASGQLSLRSGSKQKISQDKDCRKKRKVIKGENNGARVSGKKKECKVEDDIEEISSSSEDTDDEDWTS